MDLREIQEVKLQGLSDTLDMTERRKWALGLRFQGRMNCDSIPGVRKSREGLQLGEEECESDFANVESELLWRYSRDVR